MRKNALPELLISAEFHPGSAIVFEFADIWFIAVIEDVSRLDESDQMLLTIYEASDPSFSAHLPKRFWLRSVSQYVAQSRMRFPNTIERAELVHARRQHRARVRLVG